MVTSRQSVDARTEALAGLRRAGLSIPQWAEANGFNSATVKAVLYGHNKGHRGEAHKVAVALGIKKGTVVPAKGFTPVRRTAVKLSAVGGTA